MNRRGALVLLICALAMALSSGLAPARAGPGAYGWSEVTGWFAVDYGNDDAILDLAIGDLDGDGGRELIVVGYVTQAGTGRDAYIGVYRMAGGGLMQEASWAKDFAGGDDALLAVRVADYDNDGTAEIVVTGYGTNVVSGTSDRDIVVGIVRKAGRSIVEETGWYAKNFAGSGGQANYGLGLAVGNVDADSAQELVVVSRDDFGASRDTPMRIGVLGKSGSAITEKTWYQENPTGMWDYWSAVELADLDDDGTTEIVVAGTYQEYWSSIAVAAYLMDSGSVVRKGPMYVKRVGAQNNHASDLAIGDIDGDSALEVVVVGNFDDGAVNSDYGDIALGVLKYAGSQFTEKVAWFHRNIGKACAGYAYSGSDALSSVSLADVDSDGLTEIVVGGYATGDCTQHDLLVGAFALSDGAIVMDSDWYWKDFGGGYDVASSFASDLDNDTGVEVAVSGQHRPSLSGSGDGMAVVLQAITVPPTPGKWVRVVDEENNPRGGARVYLRHCYDWNCEYPNDSLACTTDSSGLCWAAAAANGDLLAATYQVMQQTTSKANHENWAYRVYLTSMDIAADGTPRLHRVAETSGAPQVLQVRKRNALIGFNVLASAEWDAHDQYLFDLQEGFKKASGYLYDASDGQMYLEEITLCDQKAFWGDSDYRVSASNQVRPAADTGGLLRPGQHIEFGRYRASDHSYGGLWTARAGHRTLIHEFGHYALGLWDEWFYRGGLLGLSEVATKCTAARQDSLKDESAASLMDNQQFASEFCSELPADPHVHLTEQQQKNGGSCWQTIDKNFSDTQVPARWEILRPDMDRGRVVAGPDALPFLSLLTRVDTRAGVVACTSARPNACPSITPTLKYSGSPVDGAEVYLKTTDGQTIYQGKTDRQGNGQIEVLGSAHGDQIHSEKVVPIRQCVFGQCVTLYRTAVWDMEASCLPGAANAALEEPPEYVLLPFAIAIRTAPGNAADTLDIAVTVSATLKSAPEVLLSQAGAPAPISVRVDPVDPPGTYAGTAVLDADHDRTGTIEVTAIDDEDRTATVFARFRVEDVSPGEDLTLYSADGKAKLYAPVGVFSEETRLGIAIGSSAGSVTGTLKFLSGPYNLLASGGATELKSPASLVLRYDASDSAGADTATLSIYRWDAVTEEWVAQDSVIWPEEQHVSAVIAELGSYALLAVDSEPPASQVNQLAGCQSGSSFAVSWSGMDQGTGIAAYDIQVREGADGAWTDWITNTTTSATTFDGMPQGTYYFRSRAIDGAGNVETYPGGDGDTHTRTSCGTWLPLILRG